MDRLRVATLNIWNRSGPWEARLGLIRAQLEALGPDLLGLQEVLELTMDGGRSTLADHIAEGGPYEVVYGEGHEVRFEGAPPTPASGGAGPRLGFGNALLSRYPIREHRVHPLPGADRSDHPRSLLEAVVELPLGSVGVFVTHLNWKLHEGAIRVDQVRAIAAIVAARYPIGGGAYPPILMGDLNAEPESDEIRFLSGFATIEGQSVFFSDVWRAVGEGRGATFSPDNPFAEPCHEPPRRIDYIFVRGPDARGRGKPLEARLCFDQPVGGVYPSDHYGVYAELRGEP